MHLRVWLVVVPSWLVPALCFFLLLLLNVYKKEREREREREGERERERERETDRETEREKERERERHVGRIVQIDRRAGSK